MRKLEKWMLAAILICGTVVCLTSCKDDDEPYPVEEDVIATPAQLKKGIWTEFDEALVTSGKYTEDQVAQMPTVGMWIEGDKGYFFTYTAEVTSEAVEGQISYDNATGTGSIIFPTIQDSPLSDQIVSFFMTTDETMEFDFTYEGQKITGHCTWLCENLDNWSSDITDEDWKELMSLYEQIAATSGPDASIDWSQSVEVEVEGQNVTVENLDEPLVWIEDIPETKAETRAVGIGTVVSIGANILGALFGGDEPDPSVAINQKLDKITGKLDEVLAGQANMMKQMNLQFNQMEEHFKEVNQRLTAIAKQMNQQEAITALNNRNTTYYNKLKVRNTSYFDAAYDLYTAHKDDLSQVSADLGDYAKKWVGTDEQFLSLTWEYIEYLTSVQHSTYGTGMDKIYDGMTFDKYPWEHMGTGDRLTYRAYDAFMVTKCLFMIALYATYSDGLNDKMKEGIYKNFTNSIDNLKGFCEFNVTNPDEFLVCQIPGAHFVMHKELQKYNYKGKNNETPHPSIYGQLAIYRPEWHEAGAITINNPVELQSKLIRWKEIWAMQKYFKSAVYPDKRDFDWYHMLVESKGEEASSSTGGVVHLGNGRATGNKLAGGAVYAKNPTSNEAILLLNEPERSANPDEIRCDGVRSAGFELYIGPVARWFWDNDQNLRNHFMGQANDPQNGKSLWLTYDSSYNYYAAIVEKRF